MPFVDGWKETECPAEVSVNDFYAAVFVKGENLTKDWLSKAVKGAYYNGGNEIVSTIGDIYEYENGVISIDINFAFTYSEGNTVKFDVDGIQSAWMSLIKAN